MRENLPGGKMVKDHNVGMIDRLFRVVFGIVFITGGLLYLAPFVSYVVLLLGVILVVTGLMGKCPLYSVLGINTCGGMCDLKKMPKSKN
jgi:hypothetical protein